MLKNFKEWETNDFLEKSREFCKNSLLKTTLDEAEEGKYPGVKIQRINTTKSYVAVCLDIDNLFSLVFETENPQEALVAIIIKSTKKGTAEKIARFIKDPQSGFLKYDVFGGDTELSPQEIANKYNLGYNMTSGDAVPYYTSTPIVKQFHVY